MASPTWSVVTGESGQRTFTVPSPEGALWTPVLDALTPGRLYRIRVIDEDARWTLGAERRECTADGLALVSRSAPLLVPGVRVGALIAKIGGSSADCTPDAAKQTVFAVGRYVVFQAPDAGKPSALFLGMNEVADNLGTCVGSLEVAIDVSG